MGVLYKRLRLTLLLTQIMITTVTYTLANALCLSFRQQRKQASEKKEYQNDHLNQKFNSSNNNNNNKNSSTCHT